MPSDPVTKINEFESKLEAIAHRADTALFEMYYKHAECEAAKYERILRDEMLSKDVIAAVETIRGGDYEPALKRRADILWFWILEAQTNTDEVLVLKNDIQDLALKIRPVINGVEVPRHQKVDIIFKNPSRDERHDAYRSEGQLQAAVGDKIRKLAKLRNAAARAIGFPDFPSVVLHFEGLTLGSLQSFIDRYEKETRADYEEFLRTARERFSLDAIEPWDSCYAVESLTSCPLEYFPKENAIPALRATVKNLGRDLDDLGIKFYTDADIPYGGLCFPIQVPNDIRILVNVKDGMNSYRLLYHEFGHALHRRFMEVTSLVLKVGDPGIYSEGLGEVWSLFIDRPAWLRAHTAATEAEIATHQDTARMAFAFRVRRYLALTLFELNYYRDPDGDMDAHFIEPDERIMGYRHEPGIWAGNHSLSLFPIYVKNYSFGRIIQKAVHAKLENLFGEFLTKPEAIDWLIRNLYAPGFSRPWRESLAAAGIEV